MRKPTPIPLEKGDNYGIVIAGAVAVMALMAIITIFVIAL